MRLTEQLLSTHRETLLERGYSLPAFNVNEFRSRTRENPVWLHFGAGNIFRAFIAQLVQQLADHEGMDRGIIVAEAFDPQIIDEVYGPYDDLSVAVSLKASGSMDKQIIASIAESLRADQGLARLREIALKKSLQLISFTITEKGYATTDSSGNLLKWIEADLEREQEKTPQTTLGIVTQLLHERYKAGGAPLALLSLDNCSENGELLKRGITLFARRRYEKGFLEYITDPARVSFPLSMIDRITPRPAQSVLEILSEDGLEQMEPIVTERNTYIAPFVNAEETGYLVIEDAFPGGRPPLEQVGVYFTDRDDVRKVERMKVSTCLNPLHTVLAIYGCLLGYTSISREMQDRELKAFITGLAYKEGLPVVTDPRIIGARDFLETTLSVRFPNPFVPDTPQRIATDTSQKIAVRFSSTLKAYLEQGREDLSFLSYIPLFIAGWLRYLLAVDDQAQPFELSPDPLLEDLRRSLKGIRFGDDSVSVELLRPLLSRRDIFEVDLFEVNLAEKITDYFCLLNAGPGAVRRSLKQLCGTDSED